MSQYRRLISYIYAYEGGVKGKNIGYAKIEVRNGQCRIQVNVKKIYVGSNEIGVYLLAPGTELFLGRIFVRNGVGEYRSQVNAENIEGSGCGIDACYGLTIHDVESTWQCYTTIWEDAVAQAAQVELEDVTAENVRRRVGQYEAGTNAKKPEQKEKEMPRAADKAKEKLPISAGIEEQLTREEISLEKLPPWDADDSAPSLIRMSPDREAAQAPEPTGGETLERIVFHAGENASACMESRFDGKTSERLDSHSDEKTPGCMEPHSDEKMLRCVEPHADEKALECIESCAEEKAQEIEWMAAEPDRAGPENPAASFTGPEDIARLKELDRLEEEGAAAENLWKRLEGLYTKLLAFDYEKGCEILSIKPQDIGLLPREIWIYGNNSFLLHGYYNYRHLILARLENPKGPSRYLLGVPGHYFRNEKYMASMFGFPHFVLSKNQPEEDGRFGYWYTDIRL